MANFIKAGSLKSNAAPVLKKAIIGNNVVAVTNNGYKISSGFAALGTATALVFGHADAIETFAGVGQVTTGAAGSLPGSYLGTWTAASNNQTVDKVSILADISKDTLYSVTPSTTIATTTGSNLLGYFTQAEATQTIETTAVTTASFAATTISQYAIWGVDPQRSTNQLVAIYVSQVLG